jgi:hypothetical protein
MRPIYCIRNSPKRKIIGISLIIGYNGDVQKLRQWFVLSFLLLIFLASSWSLLITPNFFRVHDFTHAGRIAEMSRALQDGHFPVRWTSNFGYGYGMPLFEFYGPLPFYVGSIVFILFNNVIFSIKFLYLLSNFGTMIGSYLLGKKLFGKSGGLLVAAFLTLAPYRAMNLFARGALNEVWGIMFLPWILFGLIKILHQEEGGWQTFFLSMVGLFLSHNITTMIFFPVLAIFALVYLLWMFWQKSPEFFRKGRFRGLNFLRVMWQLIASGFLAILASSFYLIPAFVEKGYTQVEKIILTPYFDYHLHFLYIRQFFNPKWGYGGSGWGTDDGISFFLGWGQLLALVSLIVIWVISIFKKLFKKDKAITSKTFFFTVLFGILFLFATFMSLLKTQFIWDKIELFKFIQFPWRWLAISIVFFAMLLASKVWLIKNKIVRSWCVGIFVVITVFSSANFFKPEQYLDNSDDFYYTDSYRIRKDLSSILPDYISSDMSEKPSRIIEGLVMSEHEDEEVLILADRTHEKLLKTNFSEPTSLELSMANYPGWKAEIDSQWWNKGRGADGNILLEVPEGSHLVTLKFEGTALRNWSDIVSLVSWLLFIYLIFPQKQVSKKVRVRND